MTIETFPQVTSNPSSRHVQATPKYIHIGQAWELRLVAEAYDVLGTSSLIVSDALAFLVDRLTHGADIDDFIRLMDERSDHSAVFIVDHLKEDLREACEPLVHALIADQFSGSPRIPETSAIHVQKACLRINNHLQRH